MLKLGLRRLSLADITAERNAVTVAIDKARDGHDPTAAPRAAALAASTTSTASVTIVTLSNDSNESDDSHAGIVTSKTIRNFGELPRLYFHNPATLCV
jgi:hypothetical protein